jgi:Arc/MetJ-type ribon-helix-helix transcriptional regulator
LLDESIRARIDADLKASVMDFIGKNKDKYRSLSDFVVAALREKLTRDTCDERAVIADQLLDLLRTNPEYRVLVGEELRAIIEESGKR